MSLFIRLLQFIPVQIAPVVFNRSHILTKSAPSILQDLLLNLTHKISYFYRALNYGSLVLIIL